MKISTLSAALVANSQWSLAKAEQGDGFGLFNRLRGHKDKDKEGNGGPPAATTEPPIANVINGNVVNPTDRYPWMTYLGCCGGSLVAPDFVLSAAHCSGCVGDARIGRHNKNSGGEMISIAQKFGHPSYNSRTTDYDYLLLKLSSSSAYAPVAINDDGAVPATLGDPLHVIGWGVTETGSSSTYLMEALVPYDDCSTSSYSNSITDRMMCAEEPNAPIQDACSGDSGGPLFIKGTDVSQDVQVGIVSWGDYPCDTPGDSGVYSRISAEYAWMEGIICSNSDADLSGTSFDCGFGTAPPTKSPSKAPTAPTKSPTKSPSSSPSTASPSSSPTTGSPTKPPTKSPSSSPSTTSPSSSPSKKPTDAPTIPCHKDGYNIGSCPSGSDKACCSGACFKNGRWAGQCK